MLKKNFITLILILLLTSCKNSSIDLSKVEHIIEIDQTIKTKYLDVLDSCHFVALETTKESVIHEINTIRFTNELILVAARGDEGVFIFNINNGKFIRHINMQGSGPEEYSRIDDFYVRESKREIDILDATLKKIISYNFEGDFIKEVKIPMNTAKEFSYLNEDIVFLNSKATGGKKIPYECVVMSNSKIRNKYLKIRKPIDIFFKTKNSMLTRDGEIYFRPLYSTVLYQVFKDSIYPKYYFDFKGDWLNDKLIYSEVSQPSIFIKKLDEINKAAFLSTNVGKDKIAFSFYKNKNDYNLLYDIKTKKTMEIIDYKECISRYSNFDYYYEGKFVSLKEPSLIKDDFKSKVNGSQYLKKEFVDSLNPYGNPVLMFTKFKDI